MYYNDTYMCSCYAFVSLTLCNWEDLKKIKKKLFIILENFHKINKIFCQKIVGGPSDDSHIN